MSLQKLYIQPLGDSFTADQVVGNRVKTKRPVTVYEGYPGSDRTRSWPTGYLSPLVNSYIQRDNNVFWSFGEEPPLLYVKHDAKDLELVPDAGATWLKKEDKFKNPFAFDFSTFEKSIKTAAVIGGIGLGAYLLLPVMRSGLIAATKRV